LREKVIYHKDLLPVVFVTGDMGGKLDSPLYGMFDIRNKLAGVALPQGGTLGEYFFTSRKTPTRSTRSSGTANGRSPTRPSATWAPPMPSA
jgi:hypothetical protein